MSEGTAVTEETSPAQAQEDRSRRRGWVSLYAVSFALMLAAGAVLGISARGFLNSFTLMWTSIVLSGVSIGAAIASVFLPRR